MRASVKKDNALPYLLGLVAGGVLTVSLLLWLAVRSNVIIQPQGEPAVALQVPARAPLPATLAMNRPPPAEPAALPEPAPVGTDPEGDLPTQATAVPALDNLPLVDEREADPAAAMQALSEALATADAAVEQSAGALPAAPPLSAVLPAAALPAAAPAPDPVPAVEFWQPFWKPFNTRASAQGFAENIARQTGLTVRAQESGRRGYQAAFRYETEDQRLAHLALIEARTGLKLSLR